MDKELTLSNTPRRGRRRRTRVAPSAAPSAPSARTSAAPRGDDLLEARPTPQITDELTLKLAIALGISPLNRPHVCQGYANACLCAECAARAANLSNRSADVRQPWHA
jgi:hypothetical protein